MNKPNPPWYDRIPEVEVVIDIARNLGSHRMCSPEGDSRDDWLQIAIWASEFEAIYRANPDAGDTYSEDIEAFALERAKANGWVVFDLAAHKPEEPAP